MEDYITAKLAMFRQCKTACVNETDSLQRVLKAAGDSGRVVTFGTREEPIYGYDIRKKI